MTDPLYRYHLPEDRIASEPVSPRDHSRLLIYKTATDEILFDRFFNLHKHLPKDSFLVMNETKVLPARFMLDDFELLFLPSEIDTKKRTIKAIANKRLRLADRIRLDKTHSFEVIEDTEKAFTLKADFPLTDLPRLLAKHGQTPIPNYIEKSQLGEKALRKKYQSIFAKNPGSVAAPTASLHFTKKVLKKLDTQGINRNKVTLHIGLGTFAPVLPEHLQAKRLYEEKYEVQPEEAWEIEAAKIDGKKCTAVGTTSVRTLESFARTRANSGKTDLFIFPPFEFQMIDQLLTNFHLPGSSLMMLVEAFLQDKRAKRHLKDLYAVAIEEGFRFYSFGDCMLIL